jgi:hypothetical protein
LKSRAEPAAAPRLSGCGAVRVSGDERGLGLFEVIAGTVIATLAVLGLAYTFGIGRGLIDRYEVARCALGEAQHLIDSLSVVRPGNLTAGNRPFQIVGTSAGVSSWTVDPVDDPLDGTSTSAPPDASPVDFYRLTVQVDFGLGGIADRVQLTRFVPAP